MSNYESLPEFQRCAHLLKVQFVGSHGTGKSVLVADTESLLKRHNIVPVRRIDELAQQLSDRGIQLNEQTSLDAQLSIQHLQLAEELLHRERGTHIVTDRSVFDNFCYAVLKFGQDQKYEDILRTMKSIVAFFLQYYPASHMFFVPLCDGELVDDGVRSISRKFQQDANRAIQHLMVQMRVGHYRLPVVNPRERDRWKCLVERTLFPDLPETDYFENAPDEAIWREYLKLNPGISLASRLRSDYDAGRYDPQNGTKKDERIDGTETQRMPLLFRPFRIGDERTLEAGVEVRCAETYELIKIELVDLNMPRDSQ